MVRRRLVFAPFLVVFASSAFAALGIGACGGDDNVALPFFQFPDATAGYEGGADANANEGGADASLDAPGSETSTDAGGDGAPLGDGSTGTGMLVISQVQTRGTGGGNDEFIEIYNPGSAPVTFDATWSITVRNGTVGTVGCAAALPSTLYTGTGLVIPSHKHLLLATSAYSETTVSADAAFSAGIPDAASLVLVHAAATVDALCFAYDATTTTTLTTCAVAFTCEGAPATNPHNSATTTNTDASLERKPGGAGGNATDTNANSADFATNVAADPHDLASPPVP